MGIADTSGTSFCDSTVSIDWPLDINSVTEMASKNDNSKLENLNSKYANRLGNSPRGLAAKV